MSIEIWRSLGPIRARKSQKIEKNLFLDRKSTFGVAESAITNWKWRLYKRLKRLWTICIPQNKILQTVVSVTPNPLIEEERLDRSKYWVCSSRFVLCCFVIIVYWSSLKQQDLDTVIIIKVLVSTTKKQPIKGVASHSSRNYFWMAKSQLSVWNKYVSQAIYPTIRTGKRTFANKFSKPSIAICFNLLQVCPSASRLSIECLRKGYVFRENPRINICCVPPGSVA